MSAGAIRRVLELGFPWPTVDPFLFCAHHDDAYPSGNDALGPDASLEGRRIGMDFDGLDGWRMYHGDVVPGFPRHPHRGFETITLARRGYIDHSDSLGATARFGHGDVQWMTAGRGIVHAEMFPLVNRKEPNPTELFQIWLNLPAVDKLTEPHFAMFWADSVPVHRFRNDAGRTATVTTIAGALEGRPAPSPPPSSWASRRDTHVVIWTIHLEPGATWVLPAASANLTRVAYFHAGELLRVDGQTLESGTAAQLAPDRDVTLTGGARPANILLLQGAPLGEPVAHHGPFVMSSPAEIQQAMVDYRRTEFGGWPWQSDGPVHPRDEGRFAIHADGRIERPG